MEAKIMNILWDGPEMAIKDVQHSLEREKLVNFNTVMTVMNRLLDKGILSKRMDRRTSLYKPVQSRDEFLECQSKELTHELMEEFGSSLVVNHMLDALEEVDPMLIEKLQQKILDLRKDK
nr:BlaI/MecI/CopY family transcriptional regulator [Paenibacillus chitinolyticus]